MPKPAGTFVFAFSTAQEGTQTPVGAQPLHVPTASLAERRPSSTMKHRQQRSPCQAQHRPLAVL
jgi:hypothetical protein